MDPALVDEPLAPGLHVRADPEPLAAAKQLAVDLDADLCTTELEADEVLTALTSFPPLTPDGLLLVQRLIERVAAAQRVVDRTLDRAAADVGERLAAMGAGVAVHPTTVRERAAAVLAARQQVQDVGDRLAVAGEEADVPAAPSPPAEPATPPVADTPPPVAPRRRRWFRFGRGRDRRYEEDTSESTSLLQQMAATTDEAFGARRANEARADLLVLLQAQLDRAEEDLRVVDRAWHDLAGDDPVEDVEAVVRRFDPQHEEARAVAQDAVGVRAASTLLARTVERWEEGWRSLGVEPAPPADEDWVVRLGERMARPIVVVGEASQRVEPLVSAAPAAPVVVVEELAS